ncbi:hypothetical protein [Hymenobacter sp. PAMC 26628]|uniref:hypothetical protein n=1 Tax=Hymenobacter sp. PAMC 26628 TaxID=1484118 RepID=UPI000770488C|nr:hypothetical protein [Hymenobacter sp. PAMC 26628]AMJ65917.1 hypothetical protein AXW84_11110 [Hymenobacter sp. PAMC 26628]
MEKAQTLLWIALGLGAFVYRMVQKMRATAAQESRERPRTPAVPALPTASFQELLKQMQARNAADPGAPAAPATGQFLPAPAGPAARPSTLGSRPMPVARPQERHPRRPLRRLTSLEAPATARPLSPATPVVQRGANLPRAVVTAQPDATYRPFAPAPAAESTGTAVRRLLAQPANVRAAFVLSEILNRRIW